MKRGKFGLNLPTNTNTPVTKAELQKILCCIADALTAVGGNDVFLAPPVESTDVDGNTVLTFSLTNGTVLGSYLVENITNEIPVTNVITTDGDFTAIVDKKEGDIATFENDCVKKVYKCVGGAWVLESVLRKVVFNCIYRPIIVRFDNVINTDEFKIDLSTITPALEGDYTVEYVEFIHNGYDQADASQPIGGVGFGGTFDSALVGDELTVTTTAPLGTVDDPCWTIVKATLKIITGC